MTTNSTAISVPEIPSGISTVPLKYDRWRPHQREAVTWLAQMLGKHNVAVVDAPTGAGKSLLGIAVAGVLGCNATYVTGTRQLQKQVAQDFPETVTIWGREHFPCLWHDGLTAAECTHDAQSLDEDDKCPQVDACPYLRQKAAALVSPVACVSYAYLLTEANYVGGFCRSDNRKWKDRPTLLILDEADTAPDEVARFVSITITAKQLERCNLEPPKNIKDPDAWKEWAPEAASRVALTADEIKWSVKKMRGLAPAGLIRMQRSYAGLASKLELFEGQADDNWLYELDQPDRWQFRPVWVSGFGHELWAHGHKVLAMSATMLGPSIWARDLGINIRDVCFRSIPSTFPAKNRPFVSVPVADFAHKTLTDADMMAMVRQVDKLMEKHRNEKGVIHAISYATAEYIRKHSRYGDRLVSHTDGAGRMDSLRDHVESDRPTVLMSPSFTRGLDLAGDLATWQVLCRLPFLSLGDKQTAKKRWSGGKKGAGEQWYLLETVRNIVQAAGRIVRSPTDYGVTYMLDARWERFYEENKSSFPAWFREAVTR